MIGSRGLVHPGQKVETTPWVEASMEMK
jgi:hypothetical protein